MLLLKNKKIQAIFWVFLILAAFIGGVAFVYKIVENMNRNKWVEVYALSEGMRSDIFKTLCVGNKEIINNKEIAEILDITLLKDGEWVDALFKLKLFITLDKNSRYVFEDKFIFVGSPVYFYINNINFKGVILSIDKPFLEQMQKKIDIKLRVPKVRNWFLSKVEIGDTEVDPSGRIIGKIISKEVTNAQKTFFNPFTNEVNLKEDLEYYDLLLDLNLIVEEVNGRLYYNYQELFPGKYIYIKTNRYLFTGVVDSIIEK